MILRWSLVTRHLSLLYYLFDKHHIFTVPIIHDEFQGIRITPNLYTTLQELERFCEVMQLKNGAQKV